MQKSDAGADEKLKINKFNSGLMEAIMVWSSYTLTHFCCYSPDTAKY